MLLSRALRLSQSSIPNPQSSIPISPIAFVGAGGKTTALFKLAREIAPAVVTVTTHLGTWQAPLADRHFILTGDTPPVDLEPALGSGVTLVTGPLEASRLKGLEEGWLSWLYKICERRSIPLLIEADGARQLPLKAPAAHEPLIPPFTRTAVVVAGLGGLGKPLTEEFVHRSEIFSSLSGLQPGEVITPAALASVLLHPDGGLKGIPPAARRILLLNQADTPELQAQAGALAGNLLKGYSSVLITALGTSASALAVHEPTAGIVLAAGEARRFGVSKVLLDWGGMPLVRHIARIALSANLTPVVVVTGARAEKVETAVCDLPVIIARNPDWKNGQSTSLQAGLRRLPPETGSAIFLPADQPNVTQSVLRALVHLHARSLELIIAPLVQGQRANPVLFDRDTFSDLLGLKGDIGGRGIFGRYPVTPLPWLDEGLLKDIDTPEDYESQKPRL